MRNLLVLALIIGVLVGVGILNGLTVQAEISPSSPAYQKGFAVARAIDDIVRATRKHYTGMVVRKLNNDGSGASLEYESTKGFVPLPAVFVRRIAFETAFQQGKAREWRYDVSLRSAWNLNQDQGLREGFEQRGWEFLTQQQKKHLAAGQSLKTLSWEPYVEVGRLRNKPVLRYLSADTASADACVTCHNNWERKGEIRNRRRKAGLEAGKVFQRDELLGVLAITVPLQ